MSFTIGNCIHDNHGICSESQAFQNYLCPYSSPSKCRYGMVLTESMLTPYGFQITEDDLKEQGVVYMNLTPVRKELVK